LKINRALFLLFFWTGLLNARAPVEQWGIFELVLNGPETGNPFSDVTLSARFENGGRAFSIPGFYDGDGTYRIRFMPDTAGRWTYATSSNIPDLNAKTGGFDCVSPSKGNHGPVRVANRFHFAYADGTPFRLLGTTCYGWIHAEPRVREKTLLTLSQSPFNKVRMILLPTEEPKTGLYPYEGKPPKEWDYSRFNPAFFRHIENGLRDLLAAGVEADVILFHPYGSDAFGFCGLPPESDERYLRYVIARLAAFRNVWWSVANEFDLLKSKNAADWKNLLQAVSQNDPYGRLSSIHFSNVMYDFTVPQVTHACIQSQITLEDFGRGFILRDAFKKPVVYDEVGYEGDIESRWGRLTGEEMVLRFWQGIISGTYVSHGETFSSGGVSWTSDGGELWGQSPSRIAFLKKILDEAPVQGLDPLDRWYHANPAGRAGEYYLFYFGKETPRSWTFSLPTKGTEMPDETPFHVDIIDTWNMTVTPVAGLFHAVKQGRYAYGCRENGEIPLPGRPYLALRIYRGKLGGALRNASEQ
jgi:hypothetical protein